MPAYRPRTVDGELLDQLRSAGAVVIEGPLRACCAQTILDEKSVQAVGPSLNSLRSISV